MKLAVLALLVAFAGVAHADRGERGGPRRAQNAQFRQMVLQRFDRNGDGRLEPRERKQAARALRRMANRLGKDNVRQQRKQRFIRQYDLNGDGNVGPGEMPPALANQLQPLDRNGDGWLEGNELP
jgi:hypothetical protein